VFLASLNMSITTHARTRIVRFQGGGLRFLDALGHRVVTSPRRDLDDGQHWRVSAAGDGLCTIQHVASGRFLDTHEDCCAVMRLGSTSGTQLWRIDDFGGGFATVAHSSSGRFLEATIDGDFAVVMRPAGDSEQAWRIGAP
jgi:ricin-type beta-trefoil lectin protein